MKRFLERYGPLLVALAAVAVYANSIANGFALDDNFIVRTNPRVHDLGNLRDIWLLPYWPLYGTELGLWRPLAIFGYALQWSITSAPWLFHAVNVALHATASVLAYLLLRRLTGSWAGALVGGLLFAVHPVHTEVVANIVGQAELIAAITTFAACLVHASRPDGPDVGWGRRIALVLLFLAGILAKESAIVLPGLLVAIDFAQGRVRFERALLVRYLRGIAMPLFLIGAASVLYFAVRVDVLGSIGGVDAAPNLPFLREDHRVLVAFRAWLEYVRLLVFPADLSSDYSPGVILPVDGWGPMVVVGAMTLFATVGIAALTPWFPRRGLPAAWLLITALPTSNLIMPIGVVVAERLLYTPSFSVSIIAAWLTVAALRVEVPARTRRMATGFAVAVLVLMGVRAAVRNPDWDSTESIFDALAENHPESYRAQWRNASRMFEIGQWETGEQYLQLAYRIWPDDSSLLNELGNLAIGRMQYDSAVALLEKSREYTAWVPRTQMLLSQAYVGAGQYENAVEAAQAAIASGIHFGLAYPVLAQAWEGTGELDRSIAAWRATFHHPFGASWQYHAKYARVLARAGMTDEALAVTDSTRAVLSAGDTSAIAVVDTLRATIARGCFAPGAGEEPCPDPVGDWGLLSALIVSGKNANQSQIARPDAPATSGPDTR